MSIEQLGYTFVNTPGIGGIVAIGIVTTAGVIYFLLTRWIIGSSEEHPRKKRVSKQSLRKE